MKTILGSFVVLFLASLLLSSSYAAIDPNTIIGQWSFNEGEGNTVKDSSNQKNDGTLFGGPKWVNGKSGKALEFDGQGACVQIPHKVSLPNQFTLSAWIYQEDAAITAGDDGDYGQTIMSSSDVSNNYFFWLLAHKGEEVRFYSYETEYPIANSLLTNTKPLSLKAWHHIAATAVKGGDSVIYVDGKEQARWKNRGLSPISTSFYVGDLRPSEKDCFNGIIDEPTIFNIVLSQADIGKIASGTSAVAPSGKLATTWSQIKIRGIFKQQQGTR